MRLGDGSSDGEGDGASAGGGGGGGGVCAGGGGGGRFTACVSDNVPPQGGRFEPGIWVDHVNTIACAPASSDEVVYEAVNCVPLPEAETGCGAPPSTENAALLTPSAQDTAKLAVNVTASPTFDGFSEEVRPSASTAGAVNSQRQDPSSSPSAGRIWRQAARTVPIAYRFLKPATAPARGSTSTISSSFAIPSCTAPSFGSGP